MALKFYNSVAKGLKLEVRKFWELIPTFVKVTGENGEVGGGGLFGPPILSRVKVFCFQGVQKCNIWKNGSMQGFDSLL